MWYLGRMMALSHFSLHPLPRSIPGFSMDSPQLSPSTRKSPLSLSPAFQVTLGPAEQGSSPLLSPVLSDAGGDKMDNEEMKHKVGTAPSGGLAAGGPVFANLRAGRPEGGEGWGGLCPHSPDPWDGGQAAPVKSHPEILPSLFGTHQGPL